MDESQRKAYVETKSKERAQLQEKISKLNGERAKFVAQQVKNQSVTNTLDAVMIGAIREQAARKQYRFE